MKLMATLSIYISRTCVLVLEAPVNMQMSGWPLKDQRSLKSPRKQLISYLSRSGKLQPQLWTKN